MNEPLTIERAPRRWSFERPKFLQAEAEKGAITHAQNLLRRTWNSANDQTASFSAIAYFLIGDEQIFLSFFNLLQFGHGFPHAIAFSGLSAREAAQGIRFLRRLSSAECSISRTSRVGKRRSSQVDRVRDSDVSLG